MRFGIATGLLVLTFLIAGITGLGATATAVAAILVAGLAAVGLATPTALALGVLAWALFTGFAENAYGELTFAEGDLLRLGLFASVSVLVAALLRRNAVGRRHRTELGHE